MIYVVNLNCLLCHAMLIFEFNMIFHREDTVFFIFYFYIYIYFILFFQ